MCLEQRVCSPEIAIKFICNSEEIRLQSEENERFERYSSRTGSHHEAVPGKGISGVDIQPWRHEPAVVTA